jgi:hypothetical protein
MIIPRWPKWKAQTPRSRSRTVATRAWAIVPRLKKEEGMLGDELSHYCFGSIESSGFPVQYDMVEILECSASMVVDTEAKDQECNVTQH